MIVDIKIPSPGESITEVEIAEWLVKDGDIVNKDQEIAEIDSDKATLTLSAESSGKIKILVKEGNIVPVGEIVCNIDSSKTDNTIKEDNIQNKTTKNTKVEIKKSNIVTPLARSYMQKNDVDEVKMQNKDSDKKITKQDVIDFVASNIEKQSHTRKRMSSLRRKISSRLVAAKNQTAMLTTFNEVDLSEVISLRNKYKDDFLKKHGCKLGFMSFFAKAVNLAMKEYPIINSIIEGDDIVTFNDINLGIAVSAPKGLMVPVIKKSNIKKIFELEMSIADLAVKARDGKIMPDDMTNGTFTISNGGVFGSMLSTPILNMPQSAILGMHNIIKRPVVVNDKIEIRPMMYLALSYDHRLIDGRESVSFLLKIKESLENPEAQILEGKVKKQLGI
ncbi:MAG: dihydrolipoyllysine-residue succinyltransferase [Flavobacteriales bacterium]|nr:dihydrolipoyllysine-residue succinyltransferase [Flavobacteriales bacterium]